MSKFSELWDAVVSSSGQERADAMEALAKGLWFDDQVEESIAVHHELLAVHRVEGNRRQFLNLSWRMAQHLYFKDIYPESLEIAQAALVDEDPTDDPTILGFVHQLIAMCHFELDCIPEALASNLRAKELLQSTNCHSAAGMTTVWAGENYLALGLPEQAEDLIIEGIEILQEDGTMPEFVVSGYQSLAKVNIALGQQSAARHHLVQAHAITTFIGDVTMLQSVNLQLGQVCTDLGDYSDAAKYLQAAIAEKGNPDLVKQSARASAAFARNLIASGDTDAGTAMLNELKPVLRALGIKE